MRQYKGYYIDGIHFKNKEQVDEFIKDKAVESYKTACRLFLRDFSFEASCFCADQADRLHALGFTWEEIEQFEAEAGI